MSNDKLAEALHKFVQKKWNITVGKSAYKLGQLDAANEVMEILRAHESAAAPQPQCVVWNLPEAKPKVTIDQDSVDSGDLYTLEDACWNAGWNACREAMLAAAPQQASEPVAWPFVESPGEIADRLKQALENGCPLLGAVRQVFIENTPLYTHPQPAQDAKGCVWSEDEEGNWDTGCGNMFVLTEGTPYDNEMGFCCYCGGKLDQVTQADAATAKESGR